MPARRVEAGPRTLVVAGAGGAGKSAVACALAERSAARGDRTLLVSTGRVREPLLAPDDADRSDRAPAYEQVHLNPVTLLAQWWERIVGGIRAARPPRADGDDPGFDPFVLEPPELTGLAEPEHLLTLSAIHRYATAADDAGRAYDVVIVDAPGFEELVALLTAPASIAAYLERVWPRHVRLSAPVSVDGPATGSVAGLILAERLTVLAEELAGFAADRRALELVYVLAADGARVTRARRELAALEVLGLRPSGLVLNRVLRADPRFAHDLPHPALQWFARRLSAQQVAVDGARELGDALARPVLEVDEAAVPLSGPVEAGGLAVSSPDGGDPLDRLRGAADPAEPSLRHVGGFGLDARYEWTVALPLVDPSTIALGRVEEDVVVEAEGVRRRLRLPSVLRRCVVAGATYADGELRVDFAPDPELWPHGAER
ncbi:ArsA family ATPase [Tsukamurella soli]|uniref:ArsA family ATPase n=1 Tax=Tsukamurella soli TaxID=644556 RepID=A0ABP8JC39_9ACTN